MRNFQVYLLVIIIIAATLTNAHIRLVNEKIEQHRVVLCEALDDARYAAASLVSDPGVKERAIGKFNRTMSILDCKKVGFSETFPTNVE